MATNKGKLEVYRGDSKTLTLTFTDDNEAPINITGATIAFTIKAKKTDADPGILQKTQTSHTTPLSGISSITIDAADTASLEPKVYFYDIQITLANGNKKTTAIGEFQVLKDITRL